MWKRYITWVSNSLEPNTGAHPWLGRPLLPSHSRFISCIGYMLAVLSVLVTVGANVRKTYVTLLNPPQGRIPVTEKLMIGRAHIRAGKYFYVPFRVDRAMDGAEIVGRFHTAGGDAKKVQVVIAEQKQLSKWTEGRSIPVLYSIERTTNAQLDVPIPRRGDYYLGFSNIFSGSDKDTFGDVELRFLAH
jgi:hypothetical protein